MKDDHLNYKEIFENSLPSLKKVTTNAVEVLSEAIPSLQIYNPWDYALDYYREFLNRYYSNQKPEVILIGLNPGMDGAVQTGIPFTDAYYARTALKIDPCKYIKPFQCVNPQKYVNKPMEPSAKVFYKSIMNLGVERFYNKVLVINAFPLGLGIKSTDTNKGGYQIKNVTPGNLPKSDFMG